MKTHELFLVDSDIILDEECISELSDFQEIPFKLSASTEYKYENFSDDLI